MAAIHACFRVLYREAHVLLEDLLLVSATGERGAAIDLQRDSAPDYRRFRDAKTAS
jgi:hypothetical protein